MCRRGATQDVEDALGVGLKVALEALRTSLRRRRSFPSVPTRRRRGHGRRSERTGATYGPQRLPTDTSRSRPNIKRSLVRGRAEPARRKSRRHHANVARARTSAAFGCEDPIGVGSLNTTARITDGRQRGARTASILVGSTDLCRQIVAGITLSAAGLVVPSTRLASGPGVVRAIGTSSPALVVSAPHVAAASRPPTLARSTLTAGPEDELVATAAIGTTAAGSTLPVGRHAARATAVASPSSTSSLWTFVPRVGSVGHGGWRRASASTRHTRSDDHT